MWNRISDPAAVIDEDLLESIANGNEAAFLAVYRRRQASIYRYALHLCGMTDVAADVVQETFLALLKGAAKLNADRGTVLAWLFAVARKQTLRQMAARRRHLSLEDEACELPEPAGVLDELEQAQLLERLREVIPTLPPVYREVLVLCDMQGLPYEDVAAITGCPIGTVRSRLHRGRALLAGKMRTMVGFAS
ncbi:MAG: sigma-70 family RNA polymerase sigma factor [Acidobacteria bacterium]|nr:sigma-70 family RNA polymerase sigma factor [Acidobacteriota bacterium]